MGEPADNQGKINAIVLMGVSGSGKTSVGKLLAGSLGWPFYDGDDFHPQSNIVKMSQGFALNDQDRAPWLKALGDLLAGILRRGGRAVMACSLLKSVYRDQVLGGHPGVRLAYLKGPFGLIQARLRARPDHFFKPEQLAGQFEILEEPEGALTLAVDREPATIAEEIRRSLDL